MGKWGMAAAAALVCTGAWGSGPHWLPVPGAPDLQLDLASVQQQHNLVSTWVRSPGRSALIGAEVRLPRVSRTVVLAQFDCAARTVRALAANAYDGAGRAVYLSSLPQPARRIDDADLGWTYDALCELRKSNL